MCNTRLARLDKQRHIKLARERGLQVCSTEATLVELGKGGPSRRGPDTPKRNIGALIIKNSRIRNPGTSDVWTSTNPACIIGIQADFAAETIFLGLHSLSI